MDAQYTDLPAPAGELAHHYGPRVHILSHPWPMSLLAQLCHPNTRQPMVDRLVGQLYDWLLGEVASRILPTGVGALPTRMQEFHPERGHYEGEIIDPDQRVVVVDVARGGILPAARVYNALHSVMLPENIRQDHIVASRTQDESGSVTGVEVDASKMGGPVAGTVVLIPDPMAATGTSVAAVARRYAEDPGGAPSRIAVLHLIATPEYIRRITTELPEAEIFTVRLDRGLSAPDVLETVPGERWDEERGLNERSYIVPGAGGLGEVLNNAWI